MRVRASRAAGLDMRDARRYYRRASRAADRAFLLAFRAARTQIGQFPESGSPIEPGIRASLVPGFPYRVIYRLDQRGVEIIAVAHTSREPGFWLGR